MDSNPELALSLLKYLDHCKTILLYRKPEVTAVLLLTTKHLISLHEQLQQNTEITDKLGSIEDCIISKNESAKSFVALTRRSNLREGILLSEDAGFLIETLKDTGISQENLTPGWVVEKSSDNIVYKTGAVAAAAVAIITSGIVHS